MALAGGRSTREPNLIVPIESRELVPRLIRSQVRARMRSSKLREGRSREGQVGQWQWRI